MKRFLLSACLFLGLASTTVEAQIPDPMSVHDFCWSGSAWVGCTPSAAAPSSTDTITQTTNTVAATTDTTISAASTTLRYLGIFVQTSGVSCNLAFGTAANATTGLILGANSLAGYSYVWGQADPPPGNAVHIYCSAAAQVVVLRGT